MVNRNLSWILHKRYCVLVEYTVYVWFDHGYTVTEYSCQESLEWAPDFVNKVYSSTQ